MPFITEALRSLPPLCTVAGFLTNTLQSFLQVGYHSDGLAESILPRADEFQTSYFCQQIVHRQNFGSRVPASAQYLIIPGPVHHIQSSSGGPTEECLDGGLWLDDGSADIEIIRRLQMHPWIDPWNDDDSPIEEAKIQEPCRETISQWCAEIQEHRTSGEISREYTFFVPPLEEVMTDQRPGDRTGWDQ
ncbi:uncharacterized protein ASPGLDRAFT_22649 [Aspergillus glaucus CBS 516.65]|uniref:Uncharacterized protein n=1 Tax=Aspergillus glaucus CBS 516.65 TaxID=1160497 RepID=A0A1L9VVA6_ASPGL|nr:hypothetical protein ASPGLDRAFT_22649 [Aspergillus glaucus CBS 516.65]OJJ87839.1 hypothetical protein ASPGLDRAFT_22649 [Aspergillus glaucus CBS 516.65]